MIIQIQCRVKKILTTGLHCLHRHAKCRFHGVGLATDIVESSAKAMVHVLNNIWRAAEVEKELQRKAQHNENNKETV